MITRLLKKYLGAILLYSTMVVMIVLINARFEQLNQQKSAEVIATQTTQNK